MPPADKHIVLTWEQKNSCFLPEDLKSFYLTTNGFLLTWSVNMDRSTVPVGRMMINPIGKLTRVGGATSSSLRVNASLDDLESDSEDENTGRTQPTFDSRSSLFEVDSCDGYGRVLLVYKENKAGSTDAKTEFWFLDRSLSWHFLSETFSAYYRLMLMHLGMPQWHFALTDIGLSLQAKQWFTLYSPLRLEFDSETSCINETPETDKRLALCQLDTGKLFKGKSDKKKSAPPSAQLNSKKRPIPSAKSSAQLGNKAASISSSQLSFRPPR